MAYRVKASLSYTVHLSVSGARVLVNAFINSPLLSARSLANHTALIGHLSLNLDLRVFENFCPQTVMPTQTAALLLT